jgi:hypothetical protein
VVLVDQEDHYIREAAVMSKQAKKGISRRGVLTAAAGAGASVALTACTGQAMTSPAKEGGAPKAQTGAAASGRTFSWKLQSTWTAGDFHQVNPQDFLNMVLATASEPARLVAQVRRDGRATALEGCRSR